jgi:basic membrane protein A
MKSVHLKQTGAVVASVAAVTLALTACGSKPADSESSGSGSGSGSFQACMVLDTGGVDDHSFNESSYAGMKAAAKDNSDIKISYAPSNSSNDYEPNLSAAVNKNCDTIVAVGGLMADAVKTVAAANTDSKFAEVDAPSSGDNVYGIEFNTAQGAFLGGYLAAGMTKTGTVATFGGLNIPPVTIYMDGYWEGVQYYNEKNGTSVKVLGWDETDQKGGTFANSFTDSNQGKQISDTFIGQGADIIFPVAGGAGLGAGAAAQASGGKANIIWVDTDGCESAADYCDFIISSVTKGLAGSVQEYVSKAASGSFPTGGYVGTLDNDGTGLAPFHNFDSKVPSDLKDQLDQVKKDIISGTIEITSPSQPAS